VPFDAERPETKVHLISGEEWSMHETLGLEHSVSLTKIGELSPEDLQSLQAIELPTEESGWPLTCSEEDRALAREFGVDADSMAVDYNGSWIVEFARQQVALEFSNVIYDAFPRLLEFQTEPGVFRTYFAHLHSDFGMGPTRGQVNLVLENKAGHRLVSIDAMGNRHVLAPEAGDFIFLDVFQDHAVIPNVDQGEIFAKEHPLTAAFVNLVDFDISR